VSTNSKKGTNGRLGGELSEPDVIRGAQAGDELMYRELVSRYVRPALAVALEFTHSLQDAEDLVQEAFRRVVDALPRFDVRRPFAPWFFTILRNVARNAKVARTMRNHVPIDESARDAGPRPDEVIEYMELESAVDVRLESLPFMQRACFRLCVLEGFSSVEVAEALGVNDTTVRVHVHRARRAMQDAVLQFAKEEEQ
jgi:RNA polymerase sigma-70 factor (ECF subfamily)